MKTSIFMFLGTVACLFCTTLLQAQGNKQIDNFTRVWDGGISGAVNPGNPNGVRNLVRAWELEAGFDLDNDGLKEFAAYDAIDKVFWVWENTALGVNDYTAVFTLPAPAPLFGSERSILITDMDFDGNKELVVVWDSFHPDSTDGFDALQVYEHVPGSGEFLPATPQLTFDPPRNLDQRIALEFESQAGDFDLDGNVELLLTYRGKKNLLIAVLEFQGSDIATGSFNVEFIDDGSPDGVSGNSPADINRVHGLGVGDLNGDNRPDFVMNLDSPGSNPVEIRVYTTTGTDTWSMTVFDDTVLPPIYVTARGSNATPAIADFNGDGFNEVYIIGRGMVAEDPSNEPRLWVVSPAGGGLFDLATAFNAANFTDLQVAEIVPPIAQNNFDLRGGFVADGDNDGRLEVYILSRDLTTIFATEWLGSPSGDVTDPSNYQTTAIYNSKNFTPNENVQFSNIKVFDLDGDGPDHMDIVFTSPNGEREGVESSIFVLEYGHFNPVAPTGSPRPIVIQSAMIDSLPIVSGDEIGVFDDTLCVGAGSFSGTYPLTITIWMEVSLPGGGVLPGATAGNSMSFKMWQMSSNIELPGTPTYTTGSGIFGEALTVVNPLSGTTDVTQTIPVKAGLINLISFNVLPPDLAVDVVLDDLDSLLVAQDDQGQFYIPPFSVNTIGNIDITNGYQVFITGAADANAVNVGPQLLPEDYSQSLSNTQLFMIGYPYQTPHPVEDVFAAITSSVDVVQDDLGQFWIPAFAVNTIGNMQPGKGYQIFVNQPVNFTCPVTSTLSASVAKAIRTASLSSPKYFDYQHTGLPYGVVVTGSEQRLKSGDEIAVFDGGLCVGAAVFTGEYPLVIPAWEGHDDYGLAGFKTGSKIMLHVWTSSEQLEMYAETSFANSNESTFLSGPISVLSINSLTVLESIPSTFALDQNYPNPFNPETTIRYHLPVASEVTVTVYNLRGQLIRKLETGDRKAGSHQVVWDSRSDNGRQVSSGVYFYRLQAGEFIAVKKLILLK